MKAIILNDTREKNELQCSYLVQFVDKNGYITDSKPQLLITDFKIEKNYIYSLVGRLFTIKQKGVHIFGTYNSVEECLVGMEKKIQALEEEIINNKTIINQ